MISFRIWYLNYTSYTVRLSASILFHSFLFLPPFLILNDFSLNQPWDIEIMNNIEILGPDHDDPCIFCALSSLTQPCQLCRKVDQGSTKIQHNPQNCNSAMHWSALQPISNTYSSKYKLPRLFHLTFRDVDNSFRFSDSVQHNTCAALVLQVFIVCCAG